MDSATVLHKLMDLLDKRSEADLARWLRFAPQHVSRAKKPNKPLTPQFQARIRERAEEELAPETQSKVRKLLNPQLRDPLPQPDATSRAKSGWEPPLFEPIEKEAWDWALLGRNYTALREICRQARRAGFGCVLLKDGIDIGAKTASPRNSALHADMSEDNIGLHADPREFGLKAGTRLLMGAAARHGHAQELLNAFNDKTRKPIQFHEADRSAYFGYATVLKYFVLPSGEMIRPERYAVPGGIAYHDVGVMFFGLRREFYPNDVVDYPAGRLIWLAAAQRLSNFVGARILTDYGFRKRLLDNAADILYKGPTPSMLVFRVTVENKGAGSVIARFEYMLPPEFRPVTTVPRREPRPAPRP